MYLVVNQPARGKHISLEPTLPIEWKRRWLVEDLRMGVIKEATDIIHVCPPIMSCQPGVLGAQSVGFTGLYNSMLANFGAK